MKTRLVLPVAAATAALLVAGCGGGDSGSDPASLAPPKSPLFIEADVQPEGALKSNVESLAKSLGGINDLGGLIVSELESSASASGEEFDYEKEVEPWLGEKGSLFFQKYDGNEFSGYGVAVQTTDTAATQSFIDKQAESSAEPVSDGTYEGVDFKSQKDGTTIGVVDNFIAFAEDEKTFKAMVDAANGESLAGEDSFASTFDAAPGGSFADVFVNVGGLIQQSGGSIDPAAKQLLDSAGIDPANATAVASLIPGSDQVEIDVSSSLGGENPPTGDASGLLGSLPASSAAALVSADFGKRLRETIDKVDARGITGKLTPHKLKSAYRHSGIDLDKVASSIGDLGVFAEGSSEGNLAGAAVLTTKGAKEATDIVSTIEYVLQVVGTPGVTLPISGKLSGFSIRSPELGPRPVIIAARGERVAIAYGLPAATRALATGSSETLADTATYKEAVSALGSTPISGFADGPMALKLASALVPPGEEGFREAKRYLTKIDFLALGAGSSGELATAKLIAGIGK